MKDTPLSYLPRQPVAGIMLLLAALFSLLFANQTTLAASYFNTLNRPFMGFSLLEWVNEGLMAIFFLYLALTLKRILLTRNLVHTVSKLPLIAACAGVVLPAAFYLIFNAALPNSIHGWHIPIATDLILVLAILALLGNTLPPTLTSFFITLAITENLAAIVLTTSFQAAQASWFYLILIGLVYLALIACNLMGKTQHRFYLLGGMALWLLCIKAGLHAHIAGILLASTLPLRLPDQITPAPLLQWQTLLNHSVTWLILPLFVFANLGFAFADCSWTTLLSPVSFGVVLGLMVGKPLAIFATTGLLVKLRWASLPLGMTWLHLLGIALLCGVGFSMSLLMGALSLSDMALLNSNKIALLFSSTVMGFIAYWVLRLAALLSPQQ